MTDGQAMTRRLARRYIKKRALQAPANLKETLTYSHRQVAACKQARQGARSEVWSFQMNDEQRRLACLQAQS
ncbi:hypothetical protein [Abyssibacter profundi]|uniref:Uncharacterized protein n=1 Tax=Abyssibacter profundi TaxID=2182787 RepID=A0A383XRL6_9GAMM|nr:hypothetical protein [Abyssibacter profundi]PWN55270.1 hypothetical protein DEH80_13690 [Abyssibacter profundi]